MGTYDTFISRNGKMAVQIKSGKCLCRSYLVGSIIDPTEFPDAVYHSPSGIVLIEGGVVRLVDSKVPDSLPPGTIHMTKWGDAFNPKTESLDDYHPVKQVLNEINL